jgi:site-specific DNA recombinase
MQKAKSLIRRCAIYTRKSSEEGLEQDFNSLHAQREACEAFIKSQAGEGWCLVKTAYDDGGLSGGTMERPALQRLLTNINEGLIDVVVVYEVDRLTRSLPTSPGWSKSSMPATYRSSRSPSSSTPRPQWEG